MCLDFSPCPREVTCNALILHCSQVWMSGNELVCYRFYSFLIFVITFPQWFVYLCFQLVMDFGIRYFPDSHFISLKCSALPLHLTKHQNKPCIFVWSTSFSSSVFLGLDTAPRRPSSSMFLLRTLETKVYRQKQLQPCIFTHFELYPELNTI